MNDENFGDQIGTQPVAGLSDVKQIALDEIAACDREIAACENRIKLKKADKKKCQRIIAAMEKDAE